MFRFNTALSVSLGLARLFSVTTKYVPTSVFWVCQAYEKMNLSSQADGQVYVGF